MSRGPGIIQQKILETLQQSEQPIQRNKLLWSIAIELDRIVINDPICDGIYSGGVEDSLEKGFQRALSKLKEKGEITVTSRKLRDLDDLIKYYPYKTGWLEIRQLRERLLPHIKTYIEGPYTYPPYSVKDNELYLLEKMRQESPKRLRTYAKRWDRLERNVLSVTPWAKTRIRDSWMGLLMKGAQLFLDNRAKYGPSFHSIIQKIDESRADLLPEEIEVLGEIQKFKVKVFKPEAMKHSHLKSLLHLVAYFGEGRKPSLKDEVKEHLLEKEPDLIKGLPNHHQPNPPSTIMRHHFPPSFDPILDAVIDRYVFTEFEFLDLPSNN